jgi:hypothetical protein
MKAFLGKDLEINNEATAVAMQTRLYNNSYCWKRCYATRCYSAATITLQQWKRGFFTSIRAEEQEYAVGMEPPFRKELSTEAEE